MENQDDSDEIKRKSNGGKIGGNQSVCASEKRSITGFARVDPTCPQDSWLARGRLPTRLKSGTRHEDNEL